MWFAAECGTDCEDSTRCISSENKRHGPAGASYIAHFLDLRGDWQLGPHRHSSKAPIINGYGLWHACGLCEYVCSYMCVHPDLHRSHLTWLNCCFLSLQPSKHNRGSVLALHSARVWGWTWVDRSHGEHQAQQYCSTYSKQPPTAHFFSFSCAFPARLYTYPHRHCLTELFFIHLAE